MALKELEFGDDALQRIQRGVDMLADAVKVTLGPRGRNVVIEQSYGPPLVTKDGVTVAMGIELDDPFENLGAQMIREAAFKTSEVAGDGTTTATVLAQAIVREGVKYVVVGMNPIELKRGIDLAVRDAVHILQEMAMPCDSPEAIARVATISASGDRAVGEMIADAITSLGKEAMISLEEGSSQDELEIVEGMQFARGYLSPYFIDDAERQNATLDGPYVLLVEQKISSIQELLPLLEQVARSKRALLVIADEVESEALTMLVTNKIQGVLRCCAVKAPGFGEPRKAWLQDIAALTGATRISHEAGQTLGKATLTHLGQIGKAEIGRDSTLLVGTLGDTRELEMHVRELRGLTKNAQNAQERQTLQERIGRLTRGVGIIRVGASTEFEMKEKKARLENALRAVRAALEEGIVPGGGVALLRACTGQDMRKAGNAVESAGRQVILRALEEPLRQIAANAGAHPSVVIAAVLKGTGPFGFDAVGEEYGDLLAKGIIDPTKVVRAALQNAASVAGLLLTTSCMVVVSDSDKTKIESR